MDNPFTPKRMGKQCVSTVWNHFTNMNGKGAKCRHCFRSIAFSKGSTSNLKRHLSAKHPNIQLFRKLHPNKGMHQDDPDPLAVSSVAVNATDDSMNQLDTLGLPGSCTQLDAYIPQSMTDEKHREIDSLLIEFICNEYLPISIVESASFQTLVNSLNSDYILPNRQSVSNALLPQTYEEKLKTVKGELLAAKSVALSSDYWTNSSTNTHYMALTGHFIDQNFKLTSRLLECSEIPSDFSEENIAQWVSKVMKRFNIDNKVEIIVTQNSRMAKAADDYTNLRRLPCFAHSLNQIVQEAIANSIQSTLAKVKHTVQHFKTNSKASQLLMQLQNQKSVKLKLDFPARWNSTYDMVDRFLQNKTSLQSYFDLFKPEITIQNYEWPVLEQALEVLNVFNKATDFICVEKSVTISHVGVLRKMLLEHLTRFADRDEIVSGVRTMICTLQEGLINQLDPFKECTFVTQSMLLDPRIKKKGFRNEPEEYQQAYETIISELMAIQGASQENKKPSFSNEPKGGNNIYREFLDWDDDDEEDELNNPRQLAVHEFDMYLKERIINTDEDPLLWWQAHNLKYPTVYNLAIRVLNVPCSSIPCEQLFTKAGQEHSQKRERLLPKQCEKVMFIQYNV
ncbi:zinc finger BED domain-containing protein 4-like [Anopheles gambiae]|uniref:zinc finger BED domain-containing protein 4-like n=1 Tax=Anopheles gambiae TaxID=7165 RepID=UPI002AC96D9A|nr:zinc finger BED domain-containing protein 4-like [Anopheles gambiae]